MHKIKAAVLANGFSSALARPFEWGNGCSDDSGAGFCELGGDESDALNVFVAVGAGETEFGGEFATDGVA